MTAAGPQTKVAGVKAHHSFITDVCRTNRGDMGAFQEVVRRLRDQYDFLTRRWPIGSDVKLHFVLTLDRPISCSQGENLMSVSYPAGDVAIPEVQRLIGMLTGATPRNVQQALKSGWVTQGYVQGLVIGEPDPSLSSVLALDDFHGELSDVEAVNVLKTLCHEGPTAQGLLDGIGGRALLKLLLPVLQKWLVHWLEKGGLEDIIGKIGSAPAGEAAPQPV
jgi:hypothetical protein